MTDERTHHITLNLARAYEFVAEFPDVPEAPAILLDEPPPLGDDRGPNAAAVLGAAVGNCLAASLAFCLRKSRSELDGLTAHVTTHVGRDDAGKLRITGIDVELEPDIADQDAPRLARCEDLFERFCIVTESVRRGIPVNVTVNERRGAAA
jgi:uncharacterized OsmC-like protein